MGTLSMERISFDPPLNLQRQAWVLSQLKHFKAESVLEVGCCTAPLLQAVLPAPLYVFPSEEWKERVQKATKVNRHEIFQPSTFAPKRVVIMDIDLKSLQEPIAVLEAEKSSQSLTYSCPRWYEMQVKVICGSLTEDFKDKVGDIDAAVATEVIEHLEEDELRLFAPSILGKYRPKILLLSTPNYSFNTKFGSIGMYPNKEADRLFRHSDHKFEWTTTEFKDWCQAVAQVHGYDVSIGGIGEGSSEENREEWNEESRFATQTAIFVRRGSQSAREEEEKEEKDIATGVPSVPLLELDYVFGAEKEEGKEETDVVRTTMDAIINYGSMIESDSEHQVHQASLWDVWFDYQVQSTSKGRLDSWFNTLGIQFEAEMWSCTGDVSLLVQERDFLLSCTLRGKDMVPDGNIIGL